MGEARAGFGELFDQFGRDLGHLLHVAAVARVQHPALDLVAGLVAVAHHFRALAQHFGGDFELVDHDRRRALFLRQLQPGLPAGHRHFAADLFGEFQRVGLAVLFLQHGQRGTQPQETHAVAALVFDLVALLAQRKTIHLDHVVQHAGEDLDRLAVLVEVEAGFLGEGLVDEAGQVHRAQQAGAVGG